MGIGIIYEPTVPGQFKNLRMPAIRLKLTEPDPILTSHDQRKIRQSPCFRRVPSSMLPMIH